MIISSLWLEFLYLEVFKDIEPVPRGARGLSQYKDVVLPL